MIGLVAGMLTTAAFIPQVIKVWKTKDTKAISLGMYSLQVVGVFLWLLHGISVKDMSILIANAFTFCLSLSILICKIKYK